ncbi:MAG: hypothetical protein ABR981_00465 [Candidatus Micrarchaeaceae archaeon]
MIKGTLKVLSRTQLESRLVLVQSRDGDFDFAELVRYGPHAESIEDVTVKYITGPNKGNKEDINSFSIVDDPAEFLRGLHPELDAKKA